jgi:hypothetical protein
MDTSRIAAFSVLADLPAPELDELAAAMREVEVEPGAKVVTLDDYGTAIYFIEEGEADVLTDSGEAAQSLGRATRSARSDSSLRESGRPLSWRVRRCGSSRSRVRTSSASEHEYLSSNARCAASALSAQAGRRCARETRCAFPPEAASASAS